MVGAIGKFHVSPSPLRHRSHDLVLETAVNGPAEIVIRRCLETNQPERSGVAAAVMPLIKP